MNAAAQMGESKKETRLPTLQDGKPRGLPYDAEGKELYHVGWTFHMDNDLLIPGSDRDQDYTGGFGLTLSGRQTKEKWWSIDPLLDGIDNSTGFKSLSQYKDAYPIHSAQLGVIVFSPSDISNQQLKTNDRPFANLVYLANSRRVVISPLDHVYQSVLTIGLLGTKIGTELQNSIHDITGSSLAKGWQHQISDGGEPTFQYSVSRQTMLRSDFQKNNTEYEIKYSLAGSVGYITETSFSLTGRWGYINTPWWSFTPENADYAYQPAPVIGDSVRKGIQELYLWGGAKIRTRAYNTFLQGQFRNSELTFDSDELRHVIGEAWIGVTTQVKTYRISYVVRYQTREIKHGAGARDPIWGGLIFSANF